MLRIYLSSVAVLALSAGMVVALDDQERAQASDKHQATVTNVDTQSHQLTVKMKDKDGKEIQRTFKFEPNLRFTDENGKVAQLNTLKAGDQVWLTEKQGQLQQLSKANQLQQPDQTGNRGQHVATITNIDRQNHSFTVKMKDRDGKDVEKTFKLTEDVRMRDENGNVARMEVFRSGDTVLIIEGEGRVREMHKAKQERERERQVPQNER